MKEIQSLQGQAYDYLIEMIKDGGLEAGKIYSLNQMAKKAGFLGPLSVMQCCG